MVSSPSGLARALLQDTPQKRLEERIQAQRKNIEIALKKTGRYELTDDEGRVFVIHTNGL